MLLPPPLCKTRQTRTGSFFNWHRKKGWKKTNYCATLFERDEVLNRVLTEALVVNLPSDGSWPACRGSWRGWCGRRPPGSWRGEQAAGGTRRGPETSWCFPGKQRKYRVDSQRWHSKTPDRNDRCCICNDMSSAPKAEMGPGKCWFTDLQVKRG